MSSLLAQNESYPTQGPGAAELIGGGIGTIVYFAVIIIVIAGSWKIYTKAGKPGWACIVPIYNMIVMMEIIGRPIWWFLLLFIPFVNIVIAFIIAFDLAKSFGKGAGFGLGLIFLSPIFYPILGFGSAQYKGPAAAA